MDKRRAPGTGQVISRGKSAKDGKEVWLIRVFSGRDGAGRKEYISKTFHGSKTKAETAMREMLHAQDKGTLVKESRESVGDYLEKWLDTHKSSLQTRTLESYQDLIARHIVPRIGRIRLSNLRTLDVQSFYTELQDDGLKSPTIRRAHAILHVAFNQAVKWQMIPRNPADNVDLPKIETPEMHAFSREEADRFTEACIYDRFGVPLTFLLDTGLRPSEAYALTWDDIDLDGNRGMVKRKLTRARGGGWTFEEPKTRKSRRPFVFPDETTRSLREWKKQQAQEILMSKKYERMNLVFANENGTPIHERNMVLRHFKPVLERASIPSHFRLYDLRHSYATLAYLAGVPVKAIIGNLGHADESMFWRVYSHLLDEQRTIAAEVYGEFRYGKKTPATHSKIP